MEQELSKHTTTEETPVKLICLLCEKYIPLPEYERHMAIHEQAEMLADILALSRR